MQASLIVVLCIASCVLAAEIPLRPVHPVFAGKQWHSGRIVGGQEAQPHSIPHQVALFLDGYFCGGSLISTTWVMTAAHCGELTDQPQVVLGAHRVQESEDTQVILVGQAPIIHPQWNPNTLQNDISLIRLPQAVPLNDNIQTISLAASNAEDFAGSTATASGWGLDSDSSTSISPVLRTVDSTILSNDDCQDQFGSGIPVYDSIVCLDGSQGKGTCSGDSGGPLTVGGVQVGLTSYGVSLGCEVGFPTGFTRISSFRSWVDQTTGM